MQVPTSAFRFAAFPSPLHCHLFPVQGEPEGNPELFPTTLGSPPWGTAKQQRGKEAKIHTLIPNSCQATEETLRVFTPVKNQSTKSPQRKLWQVLDSAEILPLTELGPELLSVPGLAPAVSLSTLPAPLQMPPDGLSRIFCGWICENWVPWGAKCTKRLIGAAPAVAELSTRVGHSLRSAQLCVREGKWSSVHLLIILPSSLSRRVCALKLYREWLRRALSPSLQQWKCDRLALLLDQLGASLKKWFIKLCFWVFHM